MSNTLRRLKAYPGERVMARNRRRGKPRPQGQYGKYGLWGPGVVARVKTDTFLEGPNNLTKFAYIANHDWYFIKLDRVGSKGPIELTYVGEADIQLIEAEATCQP